MDLQSFLALAADQRADALAALDADAFAALQTELAAHVESLLADDTTAVETLNAAADAREALTAEDTRRTEQADAEAAERDAARARLLPAEPEVETPAEPTAEVDVEPAVEAQPEPVAAAGVTVTVTPAKPAPLAAVAASAPAPAPRRSAPRTRGALVAAAGNATVNAGQQITREQLIEGMTETANGLLRGGTLSPGIERRSIVAALKTDYPAERTLSIYDSAEQTTAKMESFARLAEQPGALTASGGLCAPTAVDYGLLTLSSDERPVRDALPQLAAPRGGIRFVPPRRLSDITSGVDQYTVANDAQATPTPKSRLRLACQAPVEVLTYAVTERIVFGTLNARAFPSRSSRTWRCCRAVTRRSRSACSSAA